MYEQITKKEFINILKNSENEILYTNLSLLEAGCTKIMKALYDGNFEVKNGRKCEKVNSNSLMFDTGSYLYFSDVKKCYRHNNIIISYDERYDSFDECYRYSIIAYVIK
jgi:hypothetical protein